MSEHFLAEEHLSIGLLSVGHGHGGRDHIQKQLVAFITHHQVWGIRVLIVIELELGLVLVEQLVQSGLLVVYAGHCEALHHSFEDSLLEGVEVS